eukprot:2239725-Amphidinium_carterae.1
MLQIGIVNRLYDPNVFPTPEALKVQYQVIGLQQLYVVSTVASHPTTVGSYVTQSGSWQCRAGHERARNDPSALFL